MAVTIWDNSVRTSIADRAQRVTADAKPAWGKMNAGGMMAHINDSLRMALGDLPVKSKNLPLRYKPIRKLLIYYMPVPKGVPTAPELIARCGTAVLEDERAALMAMFHKLGSLPRNAPLPEHPAFGKLSYDMYGALMARHTDHHLKQFGV